MQYRSIPAVIHVAELYNVINHEAKQSCLCKVYHDAELWNLIM